MFNLRDLGNKKAMLFDILEGIDLNSFTYLLY